MSIQSPSMTPINVSIADHEQKSESKVHTSVYTWHMQEALPEFTVDAVYSTLASGMLDYEQDMSDATPSMFSSERHPNNAHDMTINTAMRPLMFMMTAASLRRGTSAWMARYRYFVRFVIWSCYLLCFLNLILHGPSYRNVAFDISLVLLHRWVCVAEMRWCEYLSNKNADHLLPTLFRDGRAFFTVFVWRIGVLMWLLIVGATLMIVGGWLYPIMTHLDATSLGDSMFSAWQHVFTWMHGLLMIIILLAWGSVFLCAVFMFYIFMESHKSDLSNTLRYAKQLVVYYDASKTPQDTGALLKTSYIQTSRRLKETNEHFAGLQTSWLFVTCCMTMSGLRNIRADILFINTDTPASFSYWCQDLFFVVTGVTGFVSFLFLVNNVNSWGSMFVQKIRLLPTFQTAPDKVKLRQAICQPLLRSTKIHQFAYSLCGLRLRRETTAMCTALFMQLCLITVLH